MEEIKFELTAKLSEEEWRLMNAGERVMASLALFDIEMKSWRERIRLLYPSATDEFVEEELERRLREYRQSELTG